MKIKISLIIISIFLAASTNAKDLQADSLFNLANQAFIFKQYSVSIQQYETLIAQGFKTAEIYYNTGNAYFKTGNYSRAILNYERAKLLDPSNEDIEFNLAKARTYIIDKIEVIPDFFIKTWFKSLVGVLSPDKWAVLALILFVIAGCSGIIFIFIARNNTKKPLLYSVGILVVISILFIYFAYHTKSSIEGSKSAIIIESTVIAKNSPDAESQDAFIIHEGTKVSILRTLGNWSEIKLSDGKQGWIESLAIEKI